jgi:c-di-GMP-binding flagellar brake protein YcgR
MSSTSRRKQGIPTRSQPRYPGYCDLAVSYEGHREEIPVRAPDISAGGIFINTARHFPEGAVLRIEFRLCRTDILVKARAEVRYCLPGVGVGLEFVDISPESQRAIEEEVSALQGLPPSAP